MLKALVYQDWSIKEKQLCYSSLAGLIKVSKVWNKKINTWEKNSKHTREQRLQAMMGNLFNKVQFKGERIYHETRKDKSQQKQQWLEIKACEQHSRQNF